MPHDTQTLLFELFVIFVAAKLGGELFERLRMPAVLGEILAGVIFGPFTLRWVIPSPTVLSIAELGAIFLLFTVGLETRPKDLLKVGTEATGVALGGIALPFLFGFGYMALSGHPVHESTFVAAAMVATSVGITARVLRDLDALKTLAAKIILGAAVLDDIIGMILLAFVVGLASVGGVQWLQLAVLTFEAIAFCIFMLFVAPRVMRRVSPNIGRLSTHNPQLILALTICLGLSVAAEKIGLAAIIGAFFAGLTFSDFSPRWNLQPRVEAINEFLAPFFFFTMGARLDLRVLTPQLVVSAVVICVLAIVAKIIGCGLPVLGKGYQTAMQVGVGMTPRGEVGLIVALIGLQMNMVSPSAYAIVIFMTAATTIFAPPVLRVLFKNAAAEPATAAIPGSRSSLEQITDIRTGLAAGASEAGQQRQSE
jgi:Kef-type K+ transport system membrane component KefB